MAAEIIAGNSFIVLVCGSGTTLSAALLEGYDATGIEIDAALADMARNRIAKIFDPPPKQ